MLRRVFDVLAIVFFLLLACSASLWVRQYHRDTHWSEDRTVAAQLDRKLPEVMFEGVGISDTFDFLRDVSGANVEVNWPAIEAAGISRNAPISFKGTNVTFSTALARMVDQAGLAFTPDGSTICISTRKDLRRIGDVYRPAWPWSSDADTAAEARLSRAVSIYSEENQFGFRPPLRDVIENISLQTGLPVDPQWDELKAVEIDPDTQIEMPTYVSPLDISGPRWTPPRRMYPLSWFEATLRTLSTDHDVQYQIRGGRMIVAPREWFDRQEKPIKERCFVALVGAILVWTASLIWLRHRRRRRSALLLFPVLFLGTATAIVVWEASPSRHTVRVLDRTVRVEDGPPGELVLSSRPLAFPVVGLAKDVSPSTPIVLFSIPMLRIERSGTLASVVTITSPCAALNGLLALLPGSWLFIRSRRRIVRQNRRRAGRCQFCGYDLRASGDHCPECGTMSNKSRTLISGAE